MEKEDGQTDSGSPVPTENFAGPEQQVPAVEEPKAIQLPTEGELIINGQR